VVKTTVNVLSTTDFNKWAESSSRPDSVCCAHPGSHRQNRESHKTVVVVVVIVVVVAVAAAAAAAAGKCAKGLSST